MDSCSVLEMPYDSYAKYYYGRPYQALGEITLNGKQKNIQRFLSSRI
jgi:hypothetical protein